MRNSSVLVGLVCGLLLAAILGVPLAIDLPSRLVPMWPQVVPGAGFLAWIAAIVVPVLAGFVAGRINPDESVRAGTGAGTVSALVAVSFVFVPAAAVWSASALHLAARGGRLGTAAMEDALSIALERAAWAPAVGSLGLVLIALALGALGGFLAEVSVGVPRTRVVHRSAVPMVGLLAVALGNAVHCVLAAHAELTLLPALHHPVGFGARLGLAAPALAAGVVTSLLLAWTLRDAALLWRSGRRLGALGWSGLSAVLVVAGHLDQLALWPYGWLGPWPWLAIGLEGLTALATLIRHRGSDVALAESPRHWFELAIEGLEMGIVSTGLFLLSGGATASAWGVQLLPVAWAVARGSERLEFDPRELVTRQFLVHLAAPVPMILVAVTYAALATPLWLLGLAMLRRAEARR